MTVLGLVMGLSEVALSLLKKRATAEAGIGAAAGSRQRQRPGPGRRPSAQRPVSQGDRAQVLGLVVLCAGARVQHLSEPVVVDDAVPEGEPWQAHVGVDDVVGVR